MTSPLYGRFPRPAPDPRPERLVFGPFELRLDSRELLRDGRPVKLQDQPARLLELLASRPAQIVERDAIRRHLWGDAVNVDFDQGINFSIKQIRRTLDDSAARPRFVETVPRRGYRFVAPVRRTTIPEEALKPAVADPTVLEPDASAPHARAARAARAASLAALGAVALAGAVYVALAGLPGRRSAPSSDRASTLGATVDDIPAAAREAYLEGVFLLRKEEDPRAAKIALERAVELAPDFAPAYPQLAEAYMSIPGSVAEAETTLHRALELDPDLAETRLSHSRYLFYFAYDWPAAHHEVRLALELDPDLARGHHHLACWLSSQGRHDEAIPAAERARSLEPEDLLLAADVGLFAYFARRWDRAIAESHRVLALDPNYVWAHRWIVYAALAQGHVPLALAQAKAEIRSAVAAGARAPDREIESLEDYWAWRSLGLDEDLAAPVHLAMIYLGQGRRERALDVLGQTCDRRWGWRAPYLGVFPFFDPLRSDPRFRAVLGCLGLVS